MYNKSADPNKMQIGLTGSKSHPSILKNPKVVELSINQLYVLRVKEKKMCEKYEVESFTTER